MPCAPTMVAAVIWIVQAAAAIVDDLGPDAVTMRAVAGRLGSGVMSLYRHVADRDELLDLVLAQLVAEIALPQPTGRWRDDLAGIARAVRGALVAQPGMTVLLTGRGGRGVAGPGLTEAALTVLRGAGLGPREAVLAGNALGNLVAGAALQEVAEGTEDDRTALSEIAWAGPALTATSADERFEFGLRIVLDGIAAARPAVE